uniref:MRH domain-containing protein n=1 Tax=Branchiostoma floridae TaxID=7739 RepID=C3Z8R0_BRAFL|eukprot:XP_002595154.1 hypothetical protein BRAFLDRAFT_67949 [Branchiostoma floridae]
MDQLKTSRFLLDFVTVLLFSQLVSGQQTLTCEKTGPCSCMMSDGTGEINLRPLVAANNPSFKDFPATTNPDDYLYSWNPCEPFTEGLCRDVAVCQKKKDGKVYTDLGQQDSMETDVSVDPDTGETLVSFAYSSADDKRASLVVTKCTTGETNFTAEGETLMNTFVFQLDSPCACPGVGPECTGQQPPTCEKTGPCSCNMSDGSGQVDLSPLMTGNPTFKDLVATTEPDNYLYSWNPCQPFTEGQCQNVAVCKKSNDSSVYEDIGTQDSVEISFSQDSDEGEIVTFGYTSLDGLRLSSVMAKCTTGETSIKADGEILDNNYLFELSSPCACPNAGPDCAGKTPVTCEKTGPCSCNMSDGSGEVNLQLLLSGNPTFKDYQSTIFPDGFLYSWNPCEPFSEGSCKDVAACKSVSDGSEYTDIGKQDSVQISGGRDDSSGDVVVSFAYTSADGERFKDIPATTVPDDFLYSWNPCEPFDEGACKDVALFQLTSACACPGADVDCAGPVIIPTPAPTGGLGGGSIFLIITYLCKPCDAHVCSVPYCNKSISYHARVVSAFAGYFLVGAIFNKVIRGKQGSEVVPNVQFWRNLPGYVKANSVDCNKINACSCSMADGTGVIDLSPLASTDNTPRYKGYKATQPPDAYLYDWNPCQPFTDGDCVSVAGCQSDPNGGDSYALGSQDSATFGTADDGTVLVTYSSGVSYHDLKAIQFPDDFLYSWNPCKPFTDVGSCTNVALRPARSSSCPHGPAPARTDSSSGPHGPAPARTSQLRPARSSSDPHGPFFTKTLAKKV